MIYDNIFWHLVKAPKNLIETRSSCVSVRDDVYNWLVEELHVVRKDGTHSWKFRCDGSKFCSFTFKYEEDAVHFAIVWS